MDSNLSGVLWGIMTIAGPILLGAVLLWATLHNRQTRAEKKRTEDATRQLYADSDRESKQRDGMTERKKDF